MDLLFDRLWVESVTPSLVNGAKEPAGYPAFPLAVCARPKAFPRARIRMHLSDIWIPESRIWNSICFCSSDVCRDTQFDDRLIQAHKYSCRGTTSSSRSLRALRDLSIPLIIAVLYLVFVFFFVAPLKKPESSFCYFENLINFPHWPSSNCSPSFVDNSQTCRQIIDSSMTRFVQPRHACKRHRVWLAVRFAAINRQMLRTWTRDCTLS